MNPGLVGPPNSLSVGTVEFGGEAGVTITGTPPNQVINFQIPRTIYYPEPMIVTSSPQFIPDTTVIAIINRSGQTATSILVGSVEDRGGLPLIIKDLSTGISDPTGHTITVAHIDGTETIDGDPSYTIFSNSISRGSALFIPSVDLGGWYRI